MSFRSLVLAAVALVIGIGIGVFLGGDPPKATPAAVPTRVASSDESSQAIGESTSKPIANTKRSADSEPMRAEAPVSRTLAAVAPPRGASTLQVDRTPRDPRAGEALQEREYRDDTFGPDEPGLPFPVPIDEDGAKADFERFGDGPVSREVAEEEDQDRVTEDLDAEPEAEFCLPAFSGCRQDIDCCGTSVCRSRPGTISGHFECTPG